MRGSRWRVCLAAFALTALTWRTNADDHKPAPRAIAAAEKLLQAALQSELHGDASTRAAALAEARQLDAQNRPVRWHSGQVLLDGAWTDVEQAERFARHSERLTEYRRLQTIASDAADRRDLARWCGEHRLPEEAQALWLRILRDDPYDAEAWQALGLVELDGRFYLPVELVREKQRRRQEAHHQDQYVAQFRRLVRDAARQKGDGAQFALAELRAVRDPLAIPALVQVVSGELVDRRKGPLKKLPAEASNRLVGALHAALFQALAEMPHQEATEELVDYALAVDDGPLRELAVDALRTRAAVEYVPLLMNRLAEPLGDELLFVVKDDPANHREVLTVPAEQWRQVARQMNDRAVNSAAVRYAGRLNGPSYKPRTRPLMRELKRAYPDLAQSPQFQRAMTAAYLEQRQDSVAALLADVEGNHHDWTAIAWWQAWGRYNESLAETPLLADGKKRSDEIELRSPAAVNVTLASFPAGTPVWTKFGPAPIEQVGVGDLVLSQDVDTGELAYRPVTNFGRHWPSRLVRLAAGEKHLLASRGQRFWVAGQGWQMAKLLEAGRLLHGVRGAVELGTVDVLGEAEAAEAFNLVVDEFHTYFVGENRLLVHDNGCPTQTRRALPGMAPGIAWTQRLPDRPWLQSVLDEAARLP